MSAQNNQLIHESLKTNRTWSIHLIGYDGSVAMDALPLIICSPLLRSTLVGLEDKPYPVAITIPDISVSSLKILIQFMTDGIVYATENILQQLSELIVLLGFEIYCGEYVILPAEGTETIQPGSETIQPGSETIQPGSETKQPGSETIQPGSQLQRTRSTSTNGTPKNVSNDIYGKGAFNYDDDWASESDSSSSDLEDDPSELFVCNICSISFGNTETLQLHQETRCYKHLECKVCGLKSSTLVEKLDHTCAMHDGIELYRCNICGKSYAEEHIMLVHKQMHDTVQHICPLCQMKLPTLFLLVKHVEQHTTAALGNTKKETERKQVAEMRKTMKFPKESLMCNVCRIHCGSGIDKVTHTCKVPPGHEKFTCDVCGLSYGEESVLLVHKLQHLTVAQLKAKCPLCTKVIPPILHLITHVRTHLKEYSTSSNRLLKCPKCPRKFMTRVRLTLHRYAHAGKSELECPYCLKLFNRIDATARHMITSHNRMISNDKQGKSKFTCDNCPKVFPSEPSLLVHQQSHKGKSELECPYCEKEFALRRDLLLHLRTHIGIQCRSCDTNFKNIWELREHKKKCADEANKDETKDFVEKEETEENIETEENNVSDEIVNDCTENNESPMETDQTPTEYEHKESHLRCEFCSRPFRIKARLLQHEQKHKGNSILECPICNKVCQTPQGTITHIDAHFGYTCSTCLKTGFGSYPELLNHRKLYHRKSSVGSSIK